MNTMRQQLTRALARLHREDEGTALTEFVICLPVFIFIFMGMTDIWKMQNTSVAIQITATKNMWTAALPVQKSMMGAPMHMTSQTGAVTVVQTVNKRTQISMVNKAIWLGKSAGMGLGGHFGESFYMTIPVHSRVKGSLPGGKVAKTASELLTGAQGRPVIDLVNDAPSGGVAMLRPGLAAGIRYGMVGGEAQQSVEVRLAGVRTFNFKAGYDVTVAPYPQGHDIIGRGVTMLTVSQALRTHNFYKTVYGIKFFGNPYRQ